MPATAKRSPGRPRDVNLHARRHEQILESATRVFARNGYQEADDQWIADELKLSKGTIYNYFPSKEDLFLAAVDRGVELLIRYIDQAAAKEGDVIDQMAAAIGAYLDFFYRNPNLVDLIIQERAAFRDRRQSTYFQRRQQRIGRWHRAFAELIKAGRIRNISPERVTSVLGDLVYGTMFTNHMTGRTRSSQAQTADILDVVFNGLLTDQERCRREGR
jgi:AcrR family transcriptional regulator